ncbi:MAG: hypothetical protein M0D57_21895 [Sphingobacteriales bacterium JAD_PAG50586_3]|nr:MAG: hypothetical protein M0D57_21895 [Sphingobacteriales bacterium JAD_PAG50586_3]
MKKKIKVTDSEKKLYGNAEEIERTGFKTKETESKKAATGKKAVAAPSKSTDRATTERHTPDATPGTDNG